MRKETEPDDWERQLESVVSNQALQAISRRYESSGALPSKNRRPIGPNEINARAIASKLGRLATDDVEDLARLVETRVSRRLRTLVADGSSVTVHTMDALRNHLETLSDEVSASNGALLRCQKSLSALERRVGLLEEDVGNEMLRLRNHVNSREDAFQSSPQRVQVRIDGLSDSSEKTIARQVERQISDSVQPFQRNLVETIQHAVKEEVSQSQRKCLDVIETRLGEHEQKGRDESVKMTTNIITRSITNLEKSLRIGLSTKIDGKIDEQLRENKHQQSKLLKYQMEKEMTNELSPIRDALHELDKRLSTCLSRRRAETLVESTRCSATEDMEKLEGRLTQAIVDINSKLDSLSAGQGRLTKDSQKDVVALVTDGSKSLLKQCQRIIEDEVERKVRHEISMMNHPDQHRPVQFAVEKLQARLTDLEGAVNDKLCSPQETVEGSSSSDNGIARKDKLMNKCLDAMEELEDRLGKLELDQPGLESKLTSRVSELEQIMGSIPEQLKTIGDEIAKRGNGRNLSFDDSIDELHSALQEAKRLASSTAKKPPLSTVAYNHQKSDETSSATSDTASPSSIAHLLGLQTPSRSSPRLTVTSQGAETEQEDDSGCESKSQGITEESLTEARNRMLSDVSVRLCMRVSHAN